MRDVRSEEDCNETAGFRLGWRREEVEEGRILVGRGGYDGIFNCTEG
jgi:hypothetical protein